MTKNSEGQKAYDLSDAAYDVTNLHEMIGTVADFVMEMDYGHGENRAALERVSSLLRISGGLLWSNP